MSKAGQKVVFDSPSLSLLKECTAFCCSLCIDENVSQIKIKILFVSDRPGRRHTYGPRFWRSRNNFLCYCIAYEMDK